MQVVPPVLPGLTISIEPRGREYPLPGPFACCVMVLSHERIGQRDRTFPNLKITLVLHSNAGEMFSKRPLETDRQERDPILSSFAVAHDDFSPLEIDVLYS